MHGKNRKKIVGGAIPPSVFNQIDVVLFWNGFQ